MAKMNKTTDNGCWQGNREKCPCVHWWWDWELVQALCKSGWRTLKKAKNKSTTLPRHATPWHLPQGLDIQILALPCSLLPRSQ